MGTASLSREEVPMSEAGYEFECKKLPYWIVNARTREFIAGARNEDDAKQSASKLNRAAQSAQTDERYQAIERPQ